MRTVIFAMLGERKWDLIVATSQRAKDALRVFTLDSPAHQYLNAMTLSQIFQLTDQVVGNKEWFGRWKGFFTLGETDTVDDSNLELIRDPDSVLGWTLANVLKRIELRNSQLEKLRKWASTGNRTVLWRIAHVLGRYPGKQNFATLLKLFDAKEWVRYGALRSLIEMAVVTTDTNFRDRVFKAISDRADAIFRDQRTLDEFCRAMFIQPSAAPADWGAHVLRIITKMYEKSETEQELIRWQRLAASVRQQYSAAKAS